MENIQMPAIETKRKTDAPIFRMFEKDDLQNVLKLMTEIKPIIGGSRDPSLYHVLCHEALLDKRVVFTVGELKSEIIAFLLAIIDRDRWRMSFMFCHPLIGTKMVFNRTYNRLRKLLRATIYKTGNFEPDMPDISMYLTPVSSNKSWKDSSPQIAKLLFEAVAESQRGRHIAGGLMEYMFEVLAKRGVKRADGIILSHNIPSIRFAHRLGFNFYKMGGSLFVTKDIP